MGDTNQGPTEVSSPRIPKGLPPRGWPTAAATESTLLLEDVARALSRTGELVPTIREAIGCLIPRLADLVVLMVPQNEEDWLEVVHRDPGQEIRISELLRPALPAIRRAAAREAEKGRQFRWIPSVAGPTTRFLADEAGLPELLHQLNVRTLMVVPLRSGGRILGGVGFGGLGEHASFHAADLAAAQVIARRIATRIESGRLENSAFDERTRQRRLEAALQKWTRVFQLAGWGAAIVDGLDQRIEAVNPAFARIHGYSGPDSLSGRLYTDLLIAERANEPVRWQIRGPGPAESYESFHRRADGSVFPVLTDVTPLDANVGATSYVVTIQDLSELKRAEERLRRAQRLEAVGRLAGGVAHEVNNMMTIILGFSDLLARWETIPPDRLRDIEEIRKAATRAGKITQQLLAFSRQQILQPSDLEINGVVSELVPVLRLLLPANIDLETSLVPSGATVHADPAQLDQVIINLAFNARDAMARGGTLRLVTGSRQLREQDGRRLIGIPIPAGQYALISVTDTGHGMDPDTLMQVFDPFFTTKPLGTGTGLGLATVYGIVKQSGGFVWVESSPGSGTTVTVCLPQIERLATVPESPGPAEPSAEYRTGTILVLEDEEGVRQLAQRVLEEQGHRVLEAQDGGGAIAVLDGHAAELDLVLSDVIVPGLGTAELEGAVRARRPDLPILYMSGYSREEMVDRGMIDPGRPFLQKPFTADELNGLVSRELAAEPKAQARGGPVTT